MEYVFDRPGEGCIYVPQEKLYPGVQEAGLRWGFLTETNRKAVKRLQIPELNSGFDTLRWYRNRAVTNIQSDGRGSCVRWDGEGEIPLTFVSEVVKEGNYEVQITLEAEEDVDEAMIFLGRRRLAFIGPVQGNTRFRKSFLTNICPVIPRGFSEPMEDKTIDVTILGRGLHLARVSIRPWQGRTMYIAGDSTVTDQSAEYPYLPGCSYGGWGQMIPSYLGCQMAVSNHAHSGLTTESFRSEGHYKILLDHIKCEDICLFQFGHNDQKLMALKAEEGYRSNLIRYIEEIREKGALPVLVTPLARNTWRGDDGSYNDLLKDYSRVCKETAQEYGIPFVDLHGKSMELILSLGRDGAKRYFYPSDYTHSNDYGAYCFAGYVCRELTDAGLVTVVLDDIRKWEAPEEVSEYTVPDGWEEEEALEMEELFADLERPGDELTRAEALEMVIAAMHFFPTNVYNDMFDDVIGHELYAGTVECACQNGLIPAEMTEGRRFRPQERITGGEFINILMNGYKSRKPLPDVKESVQIKNVKCAEWMYPLIMAAQALSVLPEGFLADGYLKRETGALICRKLHI